MHIVNGKKKESMRINNNMKSRLINENAFDELSTIDKLIEIERAHHQLSFIESEIKLNEVYDIYEYIRRINKERKWKRQ